MQITAGKIASLPVGAGCLVAAIAMGACQAFHIFLLVAFLSLCLALIWFPGALGGFRGYLYLGTHARIDRKTHPLLVSVMGWLLLLALPAVIYWLKSGFC